MEMTIKHLPDGRIFVTTTKKKDKIKELLNKVTNLLKEIEDETN